MINDLRLQHFRSYSDETFEFAVGVNIIVGPNASGKTNLLEALYVAAQGSSYRAKDGELIEFGNDWLRLDMHIDNHERLVKIKSSSVRPIKEFVIDDQSWKRLSPARTLPVVLFEPNHLLLLNGPPDLRRNWLDDLIAQIKPGFQTTRQHYKRVLTQRNSLLKNNPPHLADQLFVWNLRLSELGGQIVKERQALINKFNERLKFTYSELAGTTYDIEMSYQSQFHFKNYETELLHKLEGHVDLEVMRGFTVYGPHRDDILFTLNGHPMVEVASRGEVRTLLLVLKLLELKQIEIMRAQKPLLFMDDVFSELDSQRRRILTEHVGNYQTFITTTDADVVLKHFAEQSRIIPVATN